MARDKSIIIRVSGEEKAAIERLAGDACLGVSDFIRYRLLEAKITNLGCVVQPVGGESVVVGGGPRWEGLSEDEFNKEIVYRPVLSHNPAQFDSSPERLQKAFEVLNGSVVEDEWVDPFKPKEEDSELRAVPFND